MGNGQRIVRGKLTYIFILCLVGLFVLPSVYAAKRKTQTRKQQKTEDTRVYLVHADVLHYDRNINPDAQILNGKVHFRHNGATLYCDSAHFYEASNSFEAFGHVKMLQGDTLSLTSEYAFYDGDAQLARARRNVVLKHRQSTLYTDSLDYDRLYTYGYFFEGGKLVDKGSTLTSDWGEYNTATRQAVFNYVVKLKNKDFTLTTDTLYYDTRNSQAHVVGPSHIKTRNSDIDTDDGYYNSDTEQTELFGHSVIKNEGKQLTGDSVYYNSKTGVSEAFNNVVYNDTTNKNMLTGDYVYYDDSTGYAMATKRAVAIDYSQQDSLFMHADTFKIFTFHINTDSVYRKIHAYNKVRAYRTDVQAVCDSLVYNSKDSCMTMYKDPIVWYNSQQVIGEQIDVFMKDSTIDRAHVIEQALSVEQMYDSIHFNQVASKEMFAFFKNGNIDEVNAKDNVQIIYYNMDEADSTLTLMNYTETSLMKVFFEDKKMRYIWMNKNDGTVYPITQIPTGKDKLPSFVWFDYIRPLNKEDIFVWRGKKKGTELKKIKRREAPKLPYQEIGDDEKGSAEEKKK